MLDRRAAALALSSAFVNAAGAGLSAQEPAAKPERPVVKESPAPIPAVKGLIEARLATAREFYEQEMIRYESTVGFATEVAIWSRRWKDEQVRLHPGPAETLGAIRDHLARMKRLEGMADAFFKAGQGREADALKMRYFRLEAEEMFAEARAAHPGVPVPEPKSEPETPAPRPPR